MAVSIRLRREGARNSPYYKVVVADSRSPRDGKFIEIIGTYDPKKPDHNSTLKLDRIEHWISQGAQPSDTVRSLIKKNRKQIEVGGQKSEVSEPAKAAPEPAVVKASPEPAPAPAAVVEEPVAPLEASSAPVEEPGAPVEEAPPQAPAKE